MVDINNSTFFVNCISWKYLLFANNVGDTATNKHITISNSDSEIIDEIIIINNNNQKEK